MVDGTTKLDSNRNQQPADRNMQHPCPTTTTMRRSYPSFLAIYTFATLLNISGVASLPFGSRPKPSADDSAEESPATAAIDAENEKTAVRGAASRASKSEEQFADASPTVESFFASTSIATNDADDDGASAALKETINQMANTQEMKDYLTATRRALHRNPELMYDLPFTSDTIATILTELDIPFTKGWAKNTHQDVYKGPGGYGLGEPKMAIECSNL